MASVAQIQANRLNAQKSTGPRTPQGKATASRNAVKHGLLAEQVVIHGEDPEEFDLYRAGMLEELAPVGVVEAMLAERAVSLAWRLRRAERLQSAVFATVYRENANDIVLWPKHGLPIQPGPDEEEVILGQVVMTDFARAQVLDRLLVYERRIESSLYRTMAQLRKEREARAAAASEQASHPAGSPAAGEESATRAKLASFGANGVDGGASAKREASGAEDVSSAKITPYGVTTNAADGNHGRDARATGSSGGVMASDERRGTSDAGFTLPDRLCETKPISEEGPARLGRQAPEGGRQSLLGKGTYARTG